MADSTGAILARQADDAGLWRAPRSDAEASLQAALRQLHDAATADRAYIAELEAALQSLR